MKREKPFVDEAAFTKWAIQVAHTHGWKVARFHRLPTRGGAWRTPVGADAAGFPDLTCVRERLLFAELKIAPNKPTVDQVDWLERLHEGGVEAYVWNDRQLEEIERTFATVITPKRMARLTLAADGDIDHAAAVGKLLAQKEGGAA